jgi:hypothetical protein
LHYYFCCISTTMLVFLFFNKLSLHFYNGSCHKHCRSAPKLHIFTIAKLISSINMQNLQLCNPACFPVTF